MSLKIRFNLLMVSSQRNSAVSMYGPVTKNKVWSFLTVFRLRITLAASDRFIYRLYGGPERCLSGSRFISCNRVISWTWYLMSLEEGTVKILDRNIFARLVLYIRTFSIWLGNWFLFLAKSVINWTALFCVFLCTATIGVLVSMRFCYCTRKALELKE